MPLFGSSQSQFDTDVEKATSESTSEENWGYIIDVCDKAGKCTDSAKNYMKAILKRLGNTDPHIAIKAVTLLDACVKNSGKTFHLEVASRDFQSEYHKLLASQKTHPKVVDKLKDSLKRWAEDESFKKDTELRLIPALYADLKSKGIDFNTENSLKKGVVLSKDPNVVQSQDEEDQIAKAIELSLKEATSSPRSASGGAPASLYPSTNLTSVTSSAPQKEPRKVRALYDFEAAEENELTFNTGEIILVLDDSDQNWWKGSNHRGEGLFPSNFVTSDLQAEPDPSSDKKKSVHFEDPGANEDAASSKVIKEPENVQIDEGKIDRLLYLFNEADPTDLESDTAEMLTLEKEVNAMGPLIDSELERVDRKHAQLTQLSADLVEAFSLYHTLMREPQFPTLPATQKSEVTNYVHRYQSGMSQLPSSMFNGNMPPPSMMYQMPPPPQQQQQQQQQPDNRQPPPMMMPPPSMHQFPPMGMGPPMPSMQPPPPSGHMMPPPPGHMMQSSMAPPAHMMQSSGQGVPPLQGLPPPGMTSMPGPGLPPPPGNPSLQDMHQIRSSFHPNIMQNFPGAMHHQGYQQNGSGGSQLPPQGGQPKGGAAPQPTPPNGPFSPSSNTHMM